MLVHFVLSLVLSLASYIYAEKGTLGFCLGVQTDSSTCKTTDDYLKDFDALKPYSSIIRVYAVSDCNTLKNIMPAVIQSEFEIVLGIDISNYALEKETLQNYLSQSGGKNIKAITVGSEDLYRGDQTPEVLAGKINEVRNLVRSNNGGNIPIGTADTWNMFVNSTNNVVISAADTLFVNAFSYWQGQAMINASASFFDDIMQSLGAIQNVKNQTDVSFWVGETGWPTAGKNYGNAVPSVANAAKFWNDGVKAMLSWGINVFAFEAFDEPWKTNTDNTGVEGNWGVETENRVPKYQLV